MKETCRNHKGAHRLSNRFTSANILLLSSSNNQVRCYRLTPFAHRLWSFFGYYILIHSKIRMESKTHREFRRIGIRKKAKKTLSTPSNHESISKIYNAKCAMRPKYWCLFRCTFLTFRMKRAIATMGTVL